MHLRSSVESSTMPFKEFSCLSLSLPLSMSIYPGNTNSVFALDYISGSLTVNGQLDRENPLYSAGFTLTVKVRWGGGGLDTLSLFVLLVAQGELYFHSV